MNNYQHAVIIGGSIAGLAAARVLSDYFDRITIIERDHPSEDDDFRSGVPQNRQPHALLKRGLVELEGLFPGFSADWAAAGAVLVDFGKDVDWFSFGRWRPRYEPGLQSYSSSRPLLEGTVRRRLVNNAKICFVYETEVIGLAATPKGERATGVIIRSRDGHQVEDILEADLIVDASGRASHTSEWLVSLGYARPKTTVINSFPGYASRIYERPQGMEASMMYIQPTPPDHKRGAILLPLEGNRIHACLIGMAKDYPPTDDAGFLSFLQTLPEKRMYDVLKDAKPLSPVVGYRRAENVLHHYGQQECWPENFVALGDAVCGFNPVYGQGMTVAVLGALKLQERLRLQRQTSDGLDGLAAGFQKELGKVVDFAWQLATGEDMRWLPITEGCSTPNFATSMRLNFMKKVMVASTKEPLVAEAFYRVMNMIASPAAFLRPNVMAKILAN